MGIMLGPSLLGRIWPQAFTYLLPPVVAPFLDVLAQLGIILYMFLVGFELDPSWWGDKDMPRLRSARQHRHAIPARNLAGVGVVSAGRRCGRTVHRLFVVRGRLDVGDGVPSVVADFNRPWNPENPAGDIGANLCRGG